MVADSYFGRKAINRGCQETVARTPSVPSSISGPVWFGVGDAFEQKKQNNPAERVASNALLPAAAAAKRGTLNYAQQNRRSVLWLAYGL